MSKKKKICFAFLGNFFLDSRIINLKESLENDNCEVSVISFDWLTPKFKTYRDKSIVVHKLTKTRPSILFYLKFFIILTFELLKTKCDIYFAENVYALPIACIIGRLKKAKVYYNSRELYGFVGGLRNRKYIQKLMTLLEKMFINKVDLVLTTGEMDSEFLQKFYGINNTVVIRNIPKMKLPEHKIDFHKMLDIPRDQFIILYQGVLIDGRAIKLLIQNLAKIPDTVFIVIGDGEKREEFEREAKNTGVHKRVYFLGAVPHNKLINYTSAADAGLCLIENISVSYYYALPNKLFEYINAGVPVLSSKLPQMEKIVNEYKVGTVIDLENKHDISSEINSFIQNKELLAGYKKNTERAARELNWDVEYSKVKDILLG